MGEEVNLLWIYTNVKRQIHSEGVPNVEYLKKTGMKTIILHIQGTIENEILMS